jgi:hypothetical protein
MKTLGILGIIGGASLLTAAPVSLQWSQKTVAISLDTAEARIGRPGTALSIAGVHRRAYRRTVRRSVVAGAVGYGVGAYYGGYGSGLLLFRTNSAVLRHWLRLVLRWIWISGVRLWIVLRRILHRTVQPRAFFRMALVSDPTSDCLDFRRPILC